MDFNFYKQYQDYPDSELLKITRNAASYQQNAVDAAAQILAERGIDPFIEESDLKDNEPIAIDKPLDNGEDLLSSVLNETKLKPVRLIYAVLILLGIRVLWASYLLFNGFRMGMEGIAQFDLEFFLSMLDVASGVIIGYLFYKERKWGWYLIFGLAVYATAYIFPLFNSIMYDYNKGYTISWQIPSLLISLINIAIIILCFQQRLRNYFTITTREVNITVIIALALPAWVLFKKYFLD